MKELDPATRGKIAPGLMLRALHWFRWSALITVLAGLAYWRSIDGSDARNGGGSVGLPMASFFLIWTITWVILYALLIPGKGLLNKVWVVASLFALIIAHAAHFFRHIHDLPWQSNLLLSIG